MDEREKQLIIDTMKDAKREFINSVKNLVPIEKYFDIRLKSEKLIIILEQLIDIYDKDNNDNFINVKRF